MVPVILNSGIMVTKVSWLAQYGLGILIGFILFALIVIGYLFIRLLKRSKFEKEMLIRAEIASEYEQRRVEAIKEKRKKAKKKTSKISAQKTEPFPEYVPQFSSEHHLKEEEKQIVNILKDREGRVEQGTLRIVTGMPKSSLSRVLKELEDRNIICKEKRGKKNIVFLK